MPVLLRAETVARPGGTGQRHPFAGTEKQAGLVASKPTKPAATPNPHLPVQTLFGDAAYWSR